MPEDILKRNNVKVSGRGARPMAFAHGFGCDQNMWRFVAPAFEDEFRVVLFDYVGSGKSDLRAYDPERYSTLEGYAQDVLDVCRALRLSDVIFVGHSVSGVVGLPASIKEPRLFERLILVGPSPRYVNDPPDYRGGFERADIEGLLDLMDKNYIGWASFLAFVPMRQRRRFEDEILAAKREAEAANRAKDALIEELSTPVIKVWDGVLLGPVVGSLSRERADLMTAVLLGAVVARRARVVILDVTGARKMDADAVQHLTRAASAVRLMGAECIITGIGADTARTLVRAGIELSETHARRTLADGLAFAMRATDARRTPPDSTP